MEYDLDSPLVINVPEQGRICFPGRLTTTSYVLLEQEDWFEDEIRFVRTLLRPGMRAVDVGANFGVYAVAIARAVGPEGRVWAFEPTPETAAYLERTLALNGCSNATLIRAAVSDHEGTVHLAIGAQPELNEIVRDALPASGSVAVPAVTLSDMSEQHGWGDVDFLKLDVEGHELQAVSGGVRFLAARSPLMMFEIKAGAQVDFGALGPLAEMNYAFYRLVPALQALVPFDAEAPVDAYQLNLFACKPDRAASLAAAGLLARADEPAPSVDVAAWERFIAGAPYIDGLASEPLAKPGFFASSGDKAYFRALCAYAGSRDARLSAGARHAHLHSAMAQAEEALRGRDRLTRMLSCARVAADLGLRERAVDHLRQAYARLKAWPDQRPSEPFLAPSLRFERLAAPSDASGWLSCAVRETLEKLREFSSLFGGEGTFELLEPVLQSRFHSAESERRCQLVRMKAGLQAGPLPSPLLCRRSEEHLNPQFWCPSGAG
jgi:protein O-GlcNAc transferase